MVLKTGMVKESKNRLIIGFMVRSGRTSDRTDDVINNLINNF